MHIMFYVLSFTLILAPIIQGEVHVYLYHVESEKYIGSYDESPDDTVYLMPDEDNAQLFTLILTEMGSIQLKAYMEDKLLDKRGGCSHEHPEIIFFHSNNQTNQMFTINNDNSIGSRCCRTCFLSSNEDDSIVVMKKRLDTMSNKDFIFKIIPKKKNCTRKYNQ